MIETVGLYNCIALFLSIAYSRVSTGLKVCWSEKDLLFISYQLCGLTDHFPPSTGVPYKCECDKNS